MNAHNIVNTPGPEISEVESALWLFPPELLGEVFAQALELDTANTSSESMKQLIDVCLVCREWRHAAMLTHRLWRSVEIRELLTPTVIDKARRWLERAGTVPRVLAVTRRSRPLYPQCFSSCHCSLDSPDLAEFLVGSMDIYHLSLTCTSSRCFLQFLKAIERAKNMRLLKGESQPGWERIKSFKLEFLGRWTLWGGLAGLHDPTTGRMEWFNYPVFSKLPPIGTLSLSLPSIPHDNPEAEDQYDLDIPVERLSGLTKLDLACDWSAGKVLNVLQFCHNLRDLTLDLIGAYFVRALNDNVQAKVDDEATLLPQVRRLTIRRAVPQALEYVRFFRAPVLEALEVEFTETIRFSHRFHRPGFGMDLLADFLRRSQCEGTLNDVGLRHTRLNDVRNLQRQVPFMKPPRFGLKFVGSGSWSWALSRNTPERAPDP